MKLLDQASALFDKEGPFTLADAKTFNALCEQAKGTEAEYLGDLWETAVMAADDEALAYLTALEDES